MTDHLVATAGPSTARVNLKPYTAELSLGSLAVGVDNIHHDVFLSPKFVETTSAYLLELVRQIANLIVSHADGSPRAASARTRRVEEAAHGAIAGLTHARQV